MPPSLADQSLASATASHQGHADRVRHHALPRDFGRPIPARQDRWPMPVAALTILGLSIAGWFALIQAGRMAASMIGP